MSDETDGGRAAEAIRELMGDPVAFARHYLATFPTFDRVVARPAVTLVVAGSYEQFRHHLAGVERDDARHHVYVSSERRLEGWHTHNVRDVVFVGTYWRSPVYRSDLLAHIRNSIRRRDGARQCDACGHWYVRRPVPVELDVTSSSENCTPETPNESATGCDVCAQSWLGLVHEIEVRSERVEIMTFERMDGRAEHYRGRQPLAHRHMVTEISSQMSHYGHADIRATANCGNRTEQWTFSPSLPLHADVDDTLERMSAIMVRVMLEVGDVMRRLREAFEAFGPELQASMSSSLRHTAEALGEFARARGLPLGDETQGLARSLRTLPRVTVDGVTMTTPAQYAAFVEYGRGARIPRELFAGVDVAEGGDETTVVEHRTGTMPVVYGRHVTTRPIAEVGRVTVDEVRAVAQRAADRALTYYDEFGTYDPATPQMRDARRRAEATLRRYLDERQRKMLDKTGAFLIRSERGNVYRIRRGKQSNVELMRRQKRGARARYAVVETYCAAPADAHSLPVADVMLAQMLMLQTDERAFLRVANASGGTWYGVDAGAEVCDEFTPRDAWPPAPRR